MNGRIIKLDAESAETILSGLDLWLEDAEIERARWEAAHLPDPERTIQTASQDGRDRNAIIAEHQALVDRIGEARDILAALLTRAA